MGLPPLDLRRLELFSRGRRLRLNTGMVRMEGPAQEEEMSNEALEAMEQQEERACDDYLDQLEKNEDGLDLGPGE